MNRLIVRGETPPPLINRRTAGILASRLEMGRWIARAGATSRFACVSKRCRERRGWTSAGCGSGGRHAAPRRAWKQEGRTREIVPVADPIRESPVAGAQPRWTPHTARPPPPSRHPARGRARVPRVCTGPACGTSGPRRRTLRFPSREFIRPAGGRHITESDSQRASFAPAGGRHVAGSDPQRASSAPFPVPSASSVMRFGSARTPKPDE
jgi:hypothetical protein